MARRYKMSRRNSRRYFSNAADLTHRKNRLSAGSTVMRGGIRL